MYKIKYTCRVWWEGSVCGCIPQPGEEGFKHRAAGKLMGLTLPITYVPLFGGRRPDSLIPFLPPQLGSYTDQYKTSLLLVVSRTLLGCCQRSLGLEAPLSSEIAVFSWEGRASKENFRSPHTRHPSGKALLQMGCAQGPLSVKRWMSPGPGAGFRAGRVFAGLSRKCYTLSSCFGGREGTREVQSRVFIA